MSLRAWAAAAWRRPGVEAACLCLQDEHGQCVPLLLWSLWLARAGRFAGDAAIDQGVALCRSVTATTIEPLRAARRGAGAADRDAWLTRELDAEHDLMERLEEVPTGRGGSPLRLAMLSERWGRPLELEAF